MKTFGNSTKYWLNDKSGLVFFSLPHNAHHSRSFLCKSKDPLLFPNGPNYMVSWIRLVLEVMCGDWAHSSKALHILRESSFWISPSVYTWTSQYVNRLWIKLETERQTEKTHTGRQAEERTSLSVSKQVKGSVKQNTQIKYLACRLFLFMFHNTEQMGHLMTSLHSLFYYHHQGYILTTAEVLCYSSYWLHHWDTWNFKTEKRFRFTLISGTIPCIHTMPSTLMFYLQVLVPNARRFSPTWQLHSNVWGSQTWQIQTGIPIKTYWPTYFSSHLGRDSILHVALDFSLSWTQTQSVKKSYWFNLQHINKTL